MRLALIADVHGNLPALEAVVAHGTASGADRFVHAGDLVGYGGFSQEVADRLRELEAMTIAGDFDTRTLAFAEHPERFTDEDRHPPEKKQAYRWAHDRMSPETRRWLAGLPRQRPFEIDGVRFLLVHGSPASFTEHLFPATAQDRFDELAGGLGADVVICGHTHRFFERRAGGVCFVNPGSVGRPDDGDPRASYALLDVAAGPSGRFIGDIVHHRLPYDLDRELAALRSFGLPAAFRTMLRQGRGLSWALEHGDP